MTAIAATVQGFFTDRLIRARQTSPDTIAAYRDTLRLLLTYTSRHNGIPLSRLDFADLDAPAIAAFLDHLEHERGNSIRTRNARLADPLPVRLRRTAPSRTLRGHHSSPGHLAETLRPHDHHVPHQQRGRCLDRRSRP